MGLIPPASIPTVDEAEHHWLRHEADKLAEPRRPRGDLHRAREQHRLPSRVEVYVGSAGHGVQWDVVTEHHVVPVHTLNTVSH